VSVEILPVATQQYRNDLHDKSWTKYQLFSKSEVKISPRHIDRRNVLST